MKKVLIVCCLLLLFYGRYEPVNLTTTQRKTKQIEVKGEVKHPGVYTVDIHADAEEVLKKAGGLKKGADVSGINQTQDLSDHSVLVVGKQQEQKKISINSANGKGAADAYGNRTKHGTAYYCISFAAALSNHRGYHEGEGY